MLAVMANKKTSGRAVFGLPGGPGVAALEQAVREAAQGDAWAAEARLPTTRELGRSYGVSNATVSRLLDRLARDGVVWRRPNGRYYRAEGARLFAGPKTYACLLRRLEHWSRVYFGIMSGFSRDFVQNQEAMLLFHNESLVRHADTSRAPFHAGAAAQTRALEEFLAVPRPNLSGVMLDDVWRDEVLEPLLPRLGAAVVSCRPTRLAGLSSVAADFAGAALAVVGHLYARGCERVLVAVPFTGAAPIDLMVAAARSGAAHLGRPLGADEVILASTEEKRRRIIDLIRGASGRVGVFCPEDNVCVQLYHECRAAGLSFPRDAALVSGMGTDVVVPTGISTLYMDYEKIGQTAARILREQLVQNVVLPAPLRIGTTS
jgi:hypothetical protein